MQFPESVKPALGGAAAGAVARAIIEKAGWATPLNEERPNRALAQACQEALSL